MPKAKEEAKQRKAEGGKKAGRGRPLAPGKLPGANGEVRVRDVLARQLGKSGELCPREKGGRGKKRKTLEGGSGVLFGEPTLALMPKAKEEAKQRKAERRPVEEGRR